MNPTSGTAKQKQVPGTVKIGTLTVKPATFLAPIADITDGPFRRIVRSFGDVGAVFTEMISSDAYTRSCERTLHMAAFTEDEHPIFFQIVGKDPARMAQAAILAETAGADAVDINMGCPSSTITRHGSGSALLKDLKLAESIVSAVRKQISIPLTVKIRSGWNRDSLVFSEFGKMAEENGVNAIFFHGRTRKEMFRDTVHYEDITRLKSECSIPVIGNGDIKDRDTLEKMMDTGCDGIMIARAAIKKPWIFAELLSGFRLSPKELISIMEKQFRELTEIYPEKLALHKMKTLSGWYSRSIPGGKKLRSGLNRIHSQAELTVLLSEFKNEISH
ncbi:MAG: tRNA-dihydrouridine synthase family protein [Acidobacteria bacterium]|nr:tRNA-dihydrouridine synthase family protein [Acidobacteriota bacterium]